MEPKTIIILIIVAGGLITFISLAFIVYKWRRIVRIAHFRANIEVGDYCRFRLGDEMVTGFVSLARPNENLLHVKHYGSLHKLKYYEIYP